MESREQIEHIFDGFIELINRFTERLLESEWSERLIKWIEAHPWIDEEALRIIAGIQWSTNTEPDDTEEMFDFQFDQRGWIGACAQQNFDMRLAKHA